MNSNISYKTSIHNNHRVVDVTDEVKSFQFQEYYYNNDITNFKTVKTFLPIMISEDYKKKIPVNFFENIFANCTDKFEIDKSLSEQERNEKCEEYSEKVIKLNTELKRIILPYVTLAWSTEKSKFEKHSITTRNELVAKINENVGTNKNPTSHYPVNAELIYDDIPTVTERIKNQKLVLKAKEDIETILYKLSDLSDLSAYLTNSQNTYRAFTSDIITKMYGNQNQLYPRSIVNYTAFQFCLKGYPFETKSERVYSISNITSKIQNKYNLIEIFNKNIDAIISFLHDLEWTDRKTNYIDFEVDTLKNAFGICIALCAFIGEEECYRETLTNSLDGALIDSKSSIGSIFFNKLNKRMNEVHE